MKTKRIIVLARHGQTNFNIERKIQDPINSHLTKMGHEQAKRLGEEINRLGLTFDVIVCADTARTKETLAEIYPEFKKMKHVRIDTRLQERYHKDLVGKNKEDIEKELKDQLNERLSWHLYFEGTNKSRLTKESYPNNESLNSVRERLSSLLSDLKDKNTILLLGSSVINQYILEHLLHGTIGVRKPQFPEGNIIDFQRNDELRIVSTDRDMKTKNYSSIKY